ncbi:GNAT family N-acetyltransferase [Acrocarpospora phusangensis]|uniref:GNAT family N-acetyltransferase n=1 Tax=Acrocarpospora phusangensis TaxID=1070424 RepID=UPI00194FE2BB|nr:GNAT family N-acetyltransferase [Acrocarpospora phusangensis]
MAHPIPISFGRGLNIRTANKADLRSILRMRGKIAIWLRSKDTDQWQSAWPDEREQAARIRAAIKANATWIICRGKRRVATLTIHDYDQGLLWSKTEGAGVPALYLSRMMVDREYAGRGIGAEMLVWAENYAATLGLRYLRLDAWTTNEKLHRYYEERGFETAGEIPAALIEERKDLVGYPSMRLFQRPVRATERAVTGRTVFSPLKRRGFEWVNTG